MFFLWLLLTSIKFVEVKMEEALMTANRNLKTKLNVGLTALIKAID
jgi:hypothetical protein